MDGGGGLLVPFRSMEYTLFQNGRHFSVLLFACKLALVASFKGNILLNFEFKNEANLKENKRPLNGGHFGIRCITTYHFFDYSLEE